MSRPAAIDDDYYEKFNLSQYSLDPILFPSFEKETRKTFFVIFLIVGVVSSFFSAGSLRTLFSVIGLATNTFHVVVLTRKSMRNNAINIILACIAINDIGITILTQFGVIMKFGRVDLARAKEHQDQMSVIHFISMLVVMFFKRNSSYLSILMAATRAIVIKNFDNSTFSFLVTGKFGIIATVVELALSLLITLLVFLVMTFDSVNDSTTFYHIKKEHIRKHDEIFTFVHYIIPASCYPILTIVLIRELQKARKKTISRDNGNIRATKMIIMMTVFFMIAEFPQGIGGILTVMTGGNQGIFAIGFSLIELFSFFTLLNSSAHFLICYKMSSSYRDEVRKILRMKERDNIANEVRPASQITTNHVKTSN